jgi:hypothetical protein
MAFVTPEAGVRLACTARPYGRECGTHIIQLERTWWCPTCGQPRDASDTREDMSVHDLLGLEPKAKEAA